MIVNFEFLGNEPLENVITCMNFKVDKVVYFGYHDTIQEQRKATDDFLKRYCGVQQVVYHSLSQKDLQSILATMRKEIANEIGRGSKVYFDITGGESLILVAFGMLSNELKQPLHMYDIPKNKLIELNTGLSTNISAQVSKQAVKFDLERYIELRGGKINLKNQKDYHDLDDFEYEQDVKKLWLVAKKYPALWNVLSHFLRKYMKPNASLQVDEDKNHIIDALSDTKIKNIECFNQIIDDLNAAGVINNVMRSNDRYSFCFKNKKLQSCLWQGGTILELHVYMNNKDICDDCRMGINLDWDGILHHANNEDVFNELDGLTLNGTVATFISCKSGAMDEKASLHALYELDTIAKRFGGKYARRRLVTTLPLNDIYQERAKEMEIELVVAN